MSTPFYKAKFDKLVLDHEKFLIQISSDGVFLTKLNMGAGEEKDCDIELTWDEIYDFGKEWAEK